ncbi:MAG: GspE/PulE family protein, partial [Syntrophomonas sp.]|nr:GspE/PulE family protein [Syntrophomonas sp.]
RFRLDGELYEAARLPHSLLAAIVSRIKIMAGMDISEKRLPQDGRFRANIEEREVDFRCSTLPTAWGEKLALRILDRAYALTQIKQLGFSADNQASLLALAHRSQGMVLVTGPSGSGKTTTLYSILTQINSIEKNIITLEDPVEYTLPGVNQVQINPKAGLTFASGLRSILRQDPDIIMVGEIRDRETARLAVQAALTGHLVFSTLHTNSAAGSVARLRDMGIEDFLLASSLAGVVSQRLVRQLCLHCRQEFVMEEQLAEKLGLLAEKGELFFRSQGCKACRYTGYRGRIALQEIMFLGPEIRDLLNRGESSEVRIEKMAIEAGMVTIMIDGITKAKEGRSSLEEVMKAIFMGGL